jgi:hypothetical protein
MLTMADDLTLGVRLLTYVPALLAVGGVVLLVGLVFAGRRRGVRRRP